MANPAVPRTFSKRFLPRLREHILGRRLLGVAPERYEYINFFVGSIDSATAEGKLLIAETGEIFTIRDLVASGWEFSYIPSQSPALPALNYEGATQVPPSLRYPAEGTIFTEVLEVPPGTGTRGETPPPVEAPLRDRLVEAYAAMRAAHDATQSRDLGNLDVNLQRPAEDDPDSNTDFGDEPTDDDDDFESDLDEDDDDF